MSTNTKEITKEQYLRAMNRNGMIAAEDMSDVFSPAELFGYGVYGNTVFIENEKFFVRYHMGESCD